MSRVSKLVVWIPCPTQQSSNAGWYLLVTRLAERLNKGKRGDFRLIHLSTEYKNGTALKTLISAIKYALKVRKLVLSGPKDSVVLFSFFYFFNVLASCVLLGHRRYIVRISGGELNLGNPVSYRLRIAMLRRASLVICLNEHTEQKLAALGIPKDRRIIVPNPVSRYFRPPKPNERKDARRALGLTDEKFVIGTVGTICQRKRQLILLEAVAKMKKRDYVTVVLCGPCEGHAEADSIYMKRCRGFAEKNGLCVIETGYVADVRQVIWALDLFVLASVCEGMPNSLLESMACGCPAIASDIPGNRDVVGPLTSPFLFPVDDVKALTGLLDRLFSSSLLRENLSESQVRRIKDVFDEAIADKAYWNCIQNVMVANR